jgi:hypothetical protein
MSLTYQLTNLTTTSLVPQDTTWHNAWDNTSVSVTGVTSNYATTYAPNTWTYYPATTTTGNQWLGGNIMPTPYDPDLVAQLQKFMEAQKAKAVEEAKIKEPEAIIEPLTAAERKTLFFDLERG